MRLCKTMLRTMLLALITLVLVSETVLAAYSYYATIQVQETGGNDYDYLPLIADIDNDYLADNGYMSLTGLDTRILSGSTELSHLIADDKVLFAIPSVGANSTGNYRYTLGNSLLSSLPIVVGHDGYLTIPDDEPDDFLELGNDFEIELEGFIDTSQSSNIVSKLQAFAVRTSSEDIIAGTLSDSYESPTSHTDSGNQWDDETNTYDDNTGTYAKTSPEISDLSWSSYLELSRSATPYTRAIRYWVTRESTQVNLIDVDAYYGGAWNDVYQGNFSTGAWETRELSSPQTVSSVRIRFYNSYDFGTYYVTVYEVDYVTDDFDTSVTAASVTVASHTIKIYADPIADELGIIVDEGEAGEVSDIIALGATTVPDNTSDWILMSNTIPYMNYYKHTVNSTLVAWYQPMSMIVGTNLDDREGTDAGETGTTEEDAVITWGSNPADLDIIVGSLVSSSQPAVSPAGEEEVPDIVPEGNVPVSGGVVDTTALEDNPLYPIVQVINEYTDYTEEQIWFFGATFIILIGMGIAVAKVPNHLLLAGTIGLVLAGFFMAMGIYQWWMMLIFGFMFIMSILMERKPVL
jgi:hypothetical protein